MRTILDKNNQMKIVYATSLLAFLAACGSPAAICDREGQSYDKFGTTQDACVAPVTVTWQPDGGYRDVAGAASEGSEVGGVGSGPDAAPSPSPDASEGPSDNGGNDNGSDGQDNGGGSPSDGGTGSDSDSSGGDGDKGDHGDGDGKGGEQGDSCACDTPGDTGTSFS